MKFTQKWCIVSLIKNATEGSVFLPQDWPTHVTILPAFCVSADSNVLMATVKEFSNREQLKLVASSDVRWGKITATLLKNTKTIQQLHNELIDELGEYNIVFNEPAYTGKNYKPHVTVQKSGRVYLGDEVVVKNLAIVDMFPGGDYKKRKIVHIASVGI